MNGNQVRQSVKHRYLRILAPVSVVVIASLALAACKTSEERGQATGTGVGAVLGALVGREMGGTKGAVVGGLIGALGGYFIGGEIGRHLDEQDRKLAAQTTVQAIENSQANGGRASSSSWVSDDNPGVSGAATAFGVGENCYSVQEVAVIPGKGDVRQETRYCEQDGQWVAV